MVAPAGGPIIALGGLGALQFVPAQFEMVIVADAVSLECTGYGDWRGSRAIHAAGNAGLFTRIAVPGAEHCAAGHLPNGDGSAAALLAQSRSAPVLVGEPRAQRVASFFGIPVVAKVGVLAAAWFARRIGSTQPISSQLDLFDFRLSDA